MTHFQKCKVSKFLQFGSVRREVQKGSKLSVVYRGAANGWRAGTRVRNRIFAESSIGAGSSPGSGHFYRDASSQLDSIWIQNPLRLEGLLCFGTRSLNERKVFH